MAAPSALHIVILAAGQGSRMRSDDPKVLHPLAGKPLLAWVIQAARTLSPEAIHVVYGHQGHLLQQSFQQEPINWVHQATPAGTGHALAQALLHIPNSSHVLVLAGDVPLIQPHTLQRFTENTENSDTAFLKLLLATPEDPTGYGRIIRDAHGNIQGIVEQKDASIEHQAIRETYSGICLARAEDFRRWLDNIQPNNAQQEYYLTDIVQLALQDHCPIRSDTVSNAMEVQGVNTQAQLCDLERYYQTQLAYELLNQGIRIADPNRIDIRGHLDAGKDCSIDINVIFEGTVVLGNHCRIGPNCFLKDVVLGDHTQVFANSVLEDAHVGEHCMIGPFARLRRGTQLAAHCKIGNFVETKNAQLDAQSKANHLSYLGDVQIGQRVNIGAGTITCNYDGANKHQTTIADDVFVGSGTELIAPVHVGKGATIGAGTTLRENAPPGALTLSLRDKKTIPDWKRPKKKQDD